MSFPLEPSSYVCAAGGRGKGTFDSGFKGGVHVFTGDGKAEKTSAAAKQMFGNSLVTKQTGPEGQMCKKVARASWIFLLSS